MRVSRVVLGSPDWQERVTLGAGFRSPRGWRWVPRLKYLADGLDGPAKLAFRRLPTDITYVRTELELRWVQEFV